MAVQCVIWPCKGVSFMLGNAFGLNCGGQEQRALGPSNFKFNANPGDDSNCAVYTHI